MTKYGLLLIVGYLFINTASFAQSEIDNLKRIVAQQKGDTIEIRALMKLGTHYSGEDISLSFRYFRKALVLAEKNKTKTSHINILNDLGGLYHKQGNYDSSLYFHRQALREATSAENSFHRADTYHLMGLTFLRMVNYDSARTNLAKGLAIATEKNYYTLQSDIYVVWGNTFLEEGNDAEALKKFIMAAKLQDSLIHDPEGESRALLNIANIQYKMGEMDKAIAYAREAQPLAEKAKFDRGLAYASQLLGRIYRKQKKFDESLTEYNKALAVYKRVGDNRSMAETLQNIGNSLFDKGSIQEAGNYYYDALKIVRRTGNPTLFTYNYSSIGYFHYSLKQYDLAIVYMDSSRVYAENTNDQYSVLDAYELLTLIKEKQGAYKSALEYHRKATRLKDSLTNEENKIGVAKLEMEYQNGRQEKEIELLKKDQELQKLELSRQQANTTIIIIALIAVVIISIILVNRYRVLNRTRRLVEMERMRNTIARDLHDDIGSTLSSINIISQMALKEANGSSPHFQRIAQHSSSMMESMSDIVWSINPNNDSLEQVISKMKEFTAEILDPLDINYTFSGEENLDAFKLDVSKRKNLFLIFKEAINNSAKYSSATSITIRFKKENNTIQVTITDNGKGFDAISSTTGNGLRNMKERADTIHGKLEVKSSPGAGTEVLLTLPIT